MPRAYSYSRFSTAKQHRGDSLRRQLELAQGYADQHNLELDTELTFQDLGVSAFRGANIIEGSLGKFIEAVDQGIVEQGSYLLVENLDRLSRDKIRIARDRFEAILDRGINIAVLSEGKVYKADSYDMTDMILSLLVMSRAHEESLMKSKRGRAKWKQLKDRAREGHKISTVAPAWLTLEDGQWKVDEEKADTVRLI